MLIQKTILAVDDEPDIVTIIKSSLRRNGFAVEGFSDPVSALEHFKQHQAEYGIILSDIRMPYMNGFEFVRKINEVNPDVKIFLMSAFEMHKSEIERVLPSIKIEGFIQKPISMRSLVSILEKQL